MRLIPFLILAAIPLVEIALLVQIGRSIGVWWILLIVLGMAGAGTFVLQRQGFAVMNRVVETMAAGKPPVAAVIDGGFLMLAGLLMITPGLMTDVAGLLLLIPWVRHRVAAWTVRRILKSATVRTAAYRQEQASVRWPGQDAPKQHPGSRTPDPSHAPDQGPIIDGEFERLDERTLDARRRANGDGRGGRGPTTGPSNGPSTGQSTGPTDTRH